MTTQLPGNDSVEAADKFPSPWTPIGVGLIGIAVNVFLILFLSALGSAVKAPLWMGVQLIWLFISPVVILVVFFWGFWRYMKNGQYFMLLYVLGIVLMLCLFFSLFLPAYIHTKEEILRVRSFFEYSRAIQECKFDDIPCLWCKKNKGSLWYADSSYHPHREEERCRAWYRCHGCGKKIWFTVIQWYAQDPCYDAFKDRICPELGNIPEEFKDSPATPTRIRSVETNLQDGALP